MKYKKSQHTKLVQKAMAREHRYCAPNYLPLPVVVSKAKGVWVWDVNGKKYLDMMSAYSAVSYGHGHPRLVKVLAEQAAQLAVISRAYYTDTLGPFLEKLCRYSGLDKALPMNSGAEAVETAIKAARLWGYKVKGIPENKAEIIVAANNFHGRTTTIIGFSSEKLYKDGFGPFAPGFKAIPFGDINALEAAVNEYTCAFLIEPIQGEGGIIVPPEGWLKKVAALCKKKKILLIVDEVQSGLGRTGKMFAFQHEIRKPDALIVGKALGGGLLPVSALVAKKEVMDQFTPGSHGSTFGGNPLAAAVGLEALTLLKDEKLVSRSKTLGAYFFKQLKKIKSPYIKDVRGKGLWIGIEVDPARIHARAVCEKLLEKGMLTKDTHETVIRLAPPLVIEKREIDYGVALLDDVLGKL